MSAEYATKIVNKSLGNSNKRLKTPLFRLQSIPMKVVEKQSHYKTRVFVLEVKTQEVKTMMEVIKSFHFSGRLRSIPRIQSHQRTSVSQRTLKYVTSKNENTWKININYVTDGTFFKIEDALKEVLKIQHIIHNPINHTMTVLVCQSPSLTKLEHR
jgi:hypothetical protein